MTSNTLIPFRATVSEKLIKNGSTFFDNSNDSIMRELLQNSRRAGATKVEIWRDKENCSYLYTDNGCGCEPGELMQLGGSNWGPPVEGQETPAGVGFFSLARRNPTVSSPSHGWTMEMTEEHFCGKLDIAPMAFPTDHAIGMVIKFDSMSGKDRSRGFLSGEGVTWPPLLRYLRGIEVFLDGQLMKSDVDFFAEFEKKCYCTRRYTDESGVEVMVGFTDHPVFEGSLELSQRHAVFNYHGYSVTATHQLLGTTWKSKGMKDGTCIAGQLRVLVPRESMLPLELPQRNEIINTEAKQALLKRAKFEMADLLLEGFGDFNLSNTKWEELLNEGYTGKVKLEERYYRRRVRPENLELDVGAFEADTDDDKVTKTHALLTPAEVLALGPKAFQLADDGMLRLLVQIPPSADPLEYVTGYQLMESLNGARGSASLPRLAAMYPEFFAVADKVLRELSTWDDLRVSGESGDTWFTTYESLFDDPDIASISENLVIQPMVGDVLVAAPFPMRAIWDWWSSDVSYVCGTFSQEWFDELLTQDVDQWVVDVCNAAAHMRALYDESWDDEAWSSEQQEEKWREDLHEALAALSGRGRDLLLDRIKIKVESLFYAMRECLAIEEGKTHAWNISFPVRISPGGAIEVGMLKLDTGEKEETAE